MLNYYEEFESLVRAYPFWWGAITAALALVIKYTVGVYWTEGVKEKRNLKKELRAKAKINSEANELRKNQEGKLFSFGFARASIYVLDYSMQGYSKDFLITTLNDMEIVPPPEYRDDYNNYLKYWSDKKAKGEIFEGVPKVALNKISIDRASGSEDKRIRLQISESPGYVHQRAATSVFLKMEEDVKIKYTSDPSHTMEPFFSSSFGVLVAVITGDGKLVFVERSKSTAVNENRVVCGAVEGMVMSDVVCGKLDPVKAAGRALSEEFGINLEHGEISAIKISACVFNCDYHEWNLVGYVDLRVFGDKYISANIHDYFTTAKGHDSWEVNDMMDIDFEPKTVAGFLRSYESQIVNYSVVTAVYALLGAYGNRGEVAKAFSEGLDFAI